MRTGGDMANRRKEKEWQNGIRKLKTGHQIQVYTGRVVDGKHERIFEFVPGGIGDARRRQREILSGLDKGIAPATSKRTVAQLLTGWLGDYVQTQCRPRTYQDHKAIVENHMIPALGSYELRRLTPDQINAYYRKLSETLSATTVRYHHRLLSQALSYAVAKEYIATNPAAKGKVLPPRRVKPQFRELQPEEVAPLLDAASETRFHLLVYFALTAGARLGELLALDWRAINLGDRPNVAIRRSYCKRRGEDTFKGTKSEKGRRVPLSPKLVLYLKSHKERLEYARSTAGKSLTPETLVFSDDGDTPYDPSVVSHTFARIARNACVTGLRFHDLRHAFASFMIMMGTPVALVSYWLGHASSTFTMDVYSHIIEKMASERIAAIDTMIPSGLFPAINADITQIVNITTPETP